MGNNPDQGFYDWGLGLWLKDISPFCKCQRILRSAFAIHIKIIIPGALSLDPFQTEAGQGFRGAPLPLPKNLPIRGRQ